jgi:hypothetical protein
MQGLAVDAFRVDIPLEASMKINVGGIDRLFRIVVGLAMIAFAATGTWGVWAYVGIVPLITGAIGMCPLYKVIGLNTCPMTKA